MQRAAVVIQPSTLLKFHNLLRQRRYRRLYSARGRAKPGPKGPSRELIEAIVELKRRIRSIRERLTWKLHSG